MNISTLGWCPSFDKRELIDSPTRRHGISPKKENELRARTIDWIAAVGKKLSMPRRVITSASVYLQQFYMRKSFKKYSNRYEVASACLVLAGKSEEYRRQPLSGIMRYCWKQQYGSDTPLKESPETKQLWTKIVELEFTILQCVEFCLEVDHPDKDLLPIIKHLFRSHPDETLRKRCAQFASFFINDALKTTACLFHAPHHIAIASIDLAFRLLEKLPKTNTKMFKPPEQWWLDIDKNLSYEILKDVIEQILDAIDMRTTDSRPNGDSQMNGYNSDHGRPRRSPPSSSSFPGSRSGHGGHNNYNSLSPLSGNSGTSGSSGSSGSSRNSLKSHPPGSSSNGYYHHNSRSHRSSHHHSSNRRHSTGFSSGAGRPGYESHHTSRRHSESRRHHPY